MKTYQFWLFDLNFPSKGGPQKICGIIICANSKLWWGLRHSGSKRALATAYTPSGRHGAIFRSGYSHILSFLRLVPSVMMMMIMIWNKN